MLALKQKPGAAHMKISHRNKEGDSVLIQKMDQTKRLGTQI